MTSIRHMACVLLRRLVFPTKLNIKRRGMVTKRKGATGGERREVKQGLALFLLPAFLLRTNFCRERERDVWARGGHVVFIRSATFHYGRTNTVETR